MISSIFGKTKPINHIIVLTFLFLLYWIVHFFVSDSTNTNEQLLLKTLVLTVLLFSVFVVNFIVKRNKMTGPNSFAMLFYAMLMLVFPETLADNNAILCSFFLLLATRRLISVRSLKNIKLKIFDATLWVLISSLFYEWALIFFLLVFAAIYIYEPKNIRNWMVPFTGIFAFFVITYCILILANNTSFLLEHYAFDLKFNVSYFLDWGNSSKFIIYIFIVLFTTVFSFLKLGKTGLGKIVTMRLVVLSFILGILLKTLVSTPGADPLMVTFFPAVIFITNYVESIQRANITEVVLIASIFIPFLVFVSSLLLK
ncbi:hypothetical protein [Maribacter halichondriae]|uniref:hypothetical protein n=1 Tax=Maribacter halichondriae TaxID=2980554 RepID=UPI0023584788|nr:hypothetical protein [Maribacter sp. Hal144]